jgi:ubiquinone/menaquinone biosynthesis C-methylase UbiE
LFVMSKQQARSFCDQFGARQDWQRFYEGPAIRDLLAHEAFEKTEATFQLGCGTGRFAERLLARSLPESATCSCFDFSSTMVALTQGRLAKYHNRAEVHFTDGSPKLALRDSRFDRVVAFGIPSEVVMAHKES